MSSSSFESNPTCNKHCNSFMPFLLPSVGRLIRCDHTDCVSWSYPIRIECSLLVQDSSKMYSFRLLKHFLSSERCRAQCGIVSMVYRCWEMQRTYTRGLAHNHLRKLAEPDLGKSNVVEADRTWNCSTSSTDHDGIVSLQKMSTIKPRSSTTLVLLAARSILTEHGRCWLHGVGGFASKHQSTT